MRYLHRENKGQALLEFALVLPILVLILMAIIDFGQIFNKWLTIQHAARDAVRYASLGGSKTNVLNRACTEAGYSTGCSEVTITPPPDYPTSSPNTWQSQDSVTVTIDASVQIFDPLMAAILGNPYTLTSSVTMLEE